MISWLTVSHSVSQSEYDGHSNHLNYHHDCCCCCYYSLSLIYSNINNFPIVIRNFILKRIFPCCCCCFISLQLQIRYSTTTTTTMMMENKIGRPILKLKISVDTPFTFINDFFSSQGIYVCVYIKDFLVKGILYFCIPKIADINSGGGQWWSNYWQQPNQTKREKKNCLIFYW